MPFKSKAQNRFIQGQAGAGAPWAQKFVQDSQHGPGSEAGLPERVQKRKLKRKGKKGKGR